MNHSMRDLGQQYLAAVWDTVSSLPADPRVAGERLGGLVESIAELEAQLAGVRLHLLREAQLSAADAVVDQARNSVRSTPAHARGALRLAEDLGERFELVAGALSEGTISPDHHGSVRLSGQLPVADAALLEAPLEALTLPASEYDTAGERPTHGARRADALVLLVQHAANAGTVPSRRADRPRVHITLSPDT